MSAPIHLVTPDRQPPPETRHDCPHPDCRRNLPATTRACRRHQAWLAAKDAEEAAS